MNDDNTGKGITVTIVDSGINFAHKKISNNLIINGINIGCYFNKETMTIDDINDSIGHGTAVALIINRAVPAANLFIVKLFQSALECNEDTLIETLNYIHGNVDCDIVNISLGITNGNRLNDLRDICHKICNKGTILISAFDNNGCISYPAAFDSVIGVDSGETCINNEDFEYVEQSLINVRAKGGVQRVAWVDPDYMVVSGSSFAAAHVTAYTAKLIQKGIRGKGNILSCFKEKSQKKYCFTDNSPKKANTNAFFEIEKAVLFPYNKEMHSIINYSDLINFTLAGIYDIRWLGNIGRRIKGIYDTCERYMMQNIDSIDWNDDFDTLILGHLSSIENIRKRNLTETIIDLCVKNSKNIYCFDSLDAYKQKYNNYIDVYWPEKKPSDIPAGRFGKLYRISSPVLGIFGTSSQQGKFTLQLFLRQYFIDRGYRVGQLGTEPSSLLFGMDEVFPMGYNSTVSVKNPDTIILLNEMIHNIELKNPEIIIVGSQSGTIPYDTGHIAQYTSMQLDFLMGTLADAVVLCINPFDDDDYILRTIKTIENIIDCKVIATALFPFGFKNSWASSVDMKTKLSDNDLESLIKGINNISGIDCFILGNTDQMEKLAKKCIDFFAV